ncbi:uncharacterized protein LOC106153684 [Lingula anatina]|uniref:Uncharacterized protein LOC106153684 n=1 Tax=Lingula anatina TaxID=7574 RepID=A0A1S3HAY6_LINAN|nr:uncharacterized protein LOC106153684 [Lingula anatina]|eukprot:XP_013383168.1 uncharacterized protein LOC106153684 [Lingula anatina]
MSDRELLHLAIQENDTDLIDMLMLDDATRKTKFNQNIPRIDLTSMTDEQVWKQFRFQREDIDRLVRLLQLPDRMIFADRTVTSGREALCVLLKRLSYPNRLVDLENVFGRCTSQLSVIVNETVDHIYDNYSHLIHNLDQPWMDMDHLMQYSEAIVSQGAPLNKCIGFVDGTVRPISRPTFLQRTCYNGHKRTHAIKFQSVVIPNGIICSLYGPMEGKRHDCALLKESGLLQQLQQLPQDVDGRFCIYGDPAYPIRPQLQCPFRGANITPEQHAFNSEMSRVRESVEWAFGKIVQTFAFLDFKKNLKLYLQPVGKLYAVGAILTNCHTCCYGGVITEFFNVHPPTLEEYLYQRN